MIVSILHCSQLPKKDVLVKVISVTEHDVFINMTALQKFSG